MGKPRYRPGNEAALLAACCQLLALRRVPFRRINTIGIPLHDGSGAFRPSPHRGVPDIIACLPPAGRFLGIECKSPTGKMSSYQRAFFNEFQIAGAACITVRKVLELDDYLQRLGVAV